MQCAGAWRYCLLGPEPLAVACRAVVQSCHGEMAIAADGNHLASARAVAPQRDVKDGRVAVRLFERAMHRHRAHWPGHAVVHQWEDEDVHLPAAPAERESVALWGEVQLSGLQLARTAERGRKRAGCEVD